MFAGPANTPRVNQCACSSPVTVKRRSGPVSTRDFGKIGSSTPKLLSVRRYITQSTTIFWMASPTGKNQVVTIAAFWQYIIYIEIVLKIREMALPRSRNNFAIQERIRKIEAAFSIASARHPAAPTVPTPTLAWSPTRRARFTGRRCTAGAAALAQFSSFRRPRAARQLGQRPCSIVSRATLTTAQIPMLA